MKLGIQVSSFRPVLKTPAQVETAFRKMKEMGCQWVQLQWIDPEVEIGSIAGAMERHGLRSAGVQDFYQTVADHPAYYQELNRATGGMWVCVSRIPEQWKTPEGISSYVRALRAMARDLAQAGQKLLFHPVTGDLTPVDGVDLVELLLQEMPELNLCADLYHLYNSGHDLDGWLRSHRDRVVMVHFKDRVLGSDGTARLVPAGQGQVPYAGIARLCRELGVEYAFAEQESWAGDPFQALAEGFRWLNDSV